MNNLAKMFIAYRQKYDVSQRSQAREMGVSAATMSRIEDGQGMDLDTIFKLLAWMKENNVR